MKYKMITLNRLNITGPLDDSTPLIVIEEILDAHDFGYDKRKLSSRKYVNSLIDNISGSRKITINRNDPSDFPFIATFINPDVKWSEQKLHEAFDFLIGFIDNDYIPHDFSPGIQTPNNLYSLNACVLYKLSRSRNLLLTRKTTMTEMCDMLKLFSRDHSELITVLRNKIPKMSKNTIINMYSFVEDKSPEFPTDIISTESLINAYNEIGNSKIERINPVSNNEAVVLAALINKIDISSAVCPYTEYMCLKFNSGFSSFHSVYCLNPVMFDLEKTFNPLLPENLYSMNQIHNFCKMEGISVSFDELQIKSLCKTWYPGYFFNCELITKIELDLLTSLKNEEFVCYGIRDISLVPYKWTELISLFKQGNKLNGCDGIPLESITKLKNLSIEMGKDELYNLICEIEFEKSKIDSVVKNMNKNYLMCGCENQLLVQEILRSIFNLGMFMRGWDGISNYPVEETIIPDQTIVENNIAEEFRVLYSKMEILGKMDLKMKEIITKLPLGRDNCGEFQVNDDPAHGLTIFERLEMVMKGEKISTINTCIRLSSNWIVPSAYYYLKAIGKTPKFIIGNLIDVT